MEYGIKRFDKIREIVIVILLSIWMIIPILKDIQIIWYKAITYEYTFIKIVGAIGLFFLIFDIYWNLKKIENKREYDKNIFPITILGIFMIWTFVSCIFSPNINNAFFGTEYRKEGYITYLAYAGFFACSFLIRSKAKKNLLINMFLVVAILNIIMVELANRGIVTGMFTNRKINTTCFWQFNHYGYYLLLATITSNLLFITQKNKIMKILYLLTYAFLMYYLILNDTLGCYLAIVATLIFLIIYCICKKKNRCIAILSIIIFIGMSFVNQEIRTITHKNISSLFGDIKNIIVAQYVKDKDVDNKDELIELAEKAGTNRMALWRNGIKFFLERPILGYGPENLGAKYEEVGIAGESGQDRPHNLLIQLATTSGIIGLVTYVTAIGIIWINGLRTMKFDNSIHVIAFFAVTSYLISAMFGNSMYYTSPYLFIFLGLLMFENINAKKNEE